MIKPLVFSKLSEVKATDVDIAKAESMCGFKFPSAFRQFCHEYNGGYVDEHSEHYSVPSRFTDFWAEYKEGGIVLSVFYGLTSNPKHCNVIEEGKSLSWLTVPLFPLAHDYFGNEIVIHRQNPEGTVYFRDHELWDAEGTPHLFPIADTLMDFYNALGPDPDVDVLGQ